MKSKGPGRPSLPPSERSPRLPKINLATIPSASVLEKISSSLFQEPFPELRFRWVLTDKNACPDCTWLAQNSDYTLEELPTYPGEGLTYCGSHCDCNLEVVFPDGTHYKIIPHKDVSLYASEWVSNKIEDTWSNEFGGEPRSLINLISEQLQYHSELLKALIVDFKNMDRVDKFFSIFAFQPSIKDLMVAKRQASKEIWSAQPPLTMEKIAKMSNKEVDKLLDLDRLIRARTIELLRGGQVLEVERQLPFWENFMLEQVSSALVAGVCKLFFSTLIAGIRKMKDWTEVPVIGAIIKSAITEAERHRTIILNEEIKIAHAHAKTVIQRIGAWGMEFERNLLNEIDYFIQFWKDTVLIFQTGTAVRNLMDNTLKAFNEMINSTLEMRPFWAFMTGKNKRILKIPSAVADQSWVKSITDLKYLQEAEKTGVLNWYERLRMLLYENLLARPERWGRTGLYAGRLRQFEKDVWKMGYIGKEFDEMTSKMAIEEVNKVFFDYSRKMEIEIGLARLFPFEQYNLRNYSYWLQDFMKHPWKLAAIRSLWHWWSSESGTDCDFKIIGKLPMFLVPGTYFDPMSWASPWKFVQLFATYKGEPKWFSARERHLKWQVKFLKTLPPEIQQRILTKSEQKSIQEYLDRQQYRWSKNIIGWIDSWFGLFPLWRKVLEYLELAEKQEWKTMFPQSRLVDAITPLILEDLSKDIKPMSRQTLFYIKGIMDVQGIPTGEEIRKEIEKQASALPLDRQRARLERMKTETDRQRRTREIMEQNEAKKALVPKIAETIYRTWELKKIVFGYLTGMYLSRSWREIYQVHRAILEEMEAGE